MIQNVLKPQVYLEKHCVKALSISIGVTRVIEETIRSLGLEMVEKLRISQPRYELLKEEKIGEGLLDLPAL